MTLHLGRDGFVFDGDDPSKILFAGRKGELGRLVSVVGMIDMSGDDILRPVHFIGGLEKIREPLEVWNEDDLVWYLSERNVKVIEIRTRTLRRKIETVVYGITAFKLDRVRPITSMKDGPNKSSVVNAVKESLLHILWDAMKFAEQMEPSREIFPGDYFEFSEFLNEVDGNIFGSLEYWWNLYSEEDGKP